MSKTSSSKLHETLERYIHRNAPDKYSYQKENLKFQSVFFFFLNPLHYFMLAAAALNITPYSLPKTHPLSNSLVIYSLKTLFL